MENEIWKDIDGKYQVSNLGNIRILNYQKNQFKNIGEIKQAKVWKDRDGYIICKVGSVHRLVAKAFIPNPNNYPCVCHKDDNPANNRIENLWWGTDKMNVQDSISKGRWPIRMGMKGKKHTKETKEQISKSCSGKKLSAWHIQRIIETHTGKIVSLETRKKQSLASKGRKSWNKGGKLKTETKEKMREKAIGRKHTMETKLKMSLSQKKRYSLKQLNENL